MKPITSFIGVILAGAMSMCAHAQDYREADYRPGTPTLEEHVGHDHGENLTSPRDMVSYFRALAEADPTRMEVRAYGESWQGRELVYAVISSAENMARLEEIQANLADLGRGEALPEDTLTDMPAVVWLSYGVHGDEVTPPDSGVFMAYHLLAARNDALVETILDNTIVIIDPVQNPDGRERFLHSFTSALGLEPQGDRYAAEHDQPWPRSRFNHYLFDLNRDWFALTQPETRQKVAAMLDWHPVVVVDSHEMGGDLSYFFPPSADPLNPNITDGQRAKQNQLGRNMARYFDRIGVPYFTREIFDAFYPGYGDMWPTLNGAVAMTFEQGSPRGLVFDRRDGTKLTYDEGVRNNVLSSLATLETVARHKDEYLRDYGTFRRTAIEEAQDATDRYVVIDLSKSRHEAESLARRLAAQGIDVQRSQTGRTHCGDQYKDGAIIVDMAQPQGRLIRTLLGTATELPEDFIEEQESRRKRGLNHELYDVTAWSMPLMDGLKVQQCSRVDLGGAVTIAADDPITALTATGGSYGFIVPWSDGGQARLVAAALREGLTAMTSDESFTKNGRDYPMGSVIFPTASNPDELGATLRDLAEDIGAEIVPMEDSWVEEGPNLGSRAFASLKAPKIAMAWGEGTSATSAGNTRFVIEHRLGLPVTPIRASTLGRADLSLYDVLILPDSGNGMADEIGSAEPIKRFVRDGGVLIALSGSLGILSDESYDLLATRSEYAAVDDEASDEGADATEEGRVPGTILESDEEYESLILDRKARPEDVPGVLVKAVANSDHWLSSGYDEANVLVSGRDIYAPLNAADGVNVFRFAGADDMLLSGYLWEENRAQLAYKPFVMAQSHGEGLVIGFTHSPTTRAYLNGLNLLLANAVMLAPARVAQ